MTKLTRANLLLVLVAGMSLGVASCQQGGQTNAKADGTGGNATGGSSGGTGGGAGSGGSSRTGGSGGTSSASGGTSTGGNLTSSGGRATGGNSAGSGGTSTGGNFGGSGGSAGGGNSGGMAGSSGRTGGAGGAGGGRGGNTSDAGPDTAKADVPGADRFGSTPDRAGGDTPVAPDVPGTDAACPSGQMMCGAACTDVTSSTTHCGGCATVCATGQTCNAGACVEGGSAGSDGCTNDPAQNLTLQQIAVYQSVKIPVMQSGSEVAAASRNAAVVQGRSTMFRVFVTLGSGWVTRDLAARLTLTPAGGSAAQYFSRKSISASSVDADLSTSFQIFVPPSAMASSLTYSVEVVECSAQSGTAGQARFPASGDIDLGVKTTGGIKIKVIPLQFNSLLPDTSDATLAIYADYMRAMYPANDISITVGDTITAASPLDWSGTLDQLRSKRSTDKPAADVYYYGMIKPADTLRTYCVSTCTTGIGFVVTSATGTTAGSGRAAMGVAFADSASAQTMAHEVGHNHGRNHAPCSTAGTISGVDSAYPYSGGLIGSWGYDARTQKLFDPTKTSDIMGYCNTKWISDYTYSGITTRVAAVNGVAMVYTPAESLSRWRVLLVDERGPRWGIPIADEVPAEGDAEAATIYDANGAALTSVAVYRTAIGDIDASMLMVPEPQPGWYAIAVAGAPALPF